MVMKERMFGTQASIGRCRAIQISKLIGEFMKKINIYTDGACSGNPGQGGWAAILIYGSTTKTISGYVDYTTNQRMELTAVIKALSILKEPCIVELFSDSAYVINAFHQGWIEKWSNNFWTSKKKDVANKDLWQELLELTKVHHVTFVKVAGHKDNTYNNAADALAREAIKKYSTIDKR